MPIQVVPVDRSAREQQALAAALTGNSINQFGHLRNQDLARQRTERQEQAVLAQLMADQPGAPAASGVGPPEPPTPGLPRETAEALIATGVAPAVLQQRFAPAASEGFSLNPGGVRFGPGGQPIAAVPAASTPPQTRDILEGDERVFQQFNPATGQFEEVGRGPAFAPDRTADLVAGTAARVDQLRADLLQEQLTEARAGRTDAETTARRQQLDARRNVLDLAGTIGEIEANLAALEGSPLEPGTGAEELARGGAGLVSLGRRLAGQPDERAQELATAFDNFRRLTSSTAILSSLDTLRNLGTISDQKFTSVRDTILDANATPGAIRSALADIAEANSRAGRDLGLELPELEALIPQLRGQPAPGGVAHGGAPAAGPLSPAEQQELEALRRAQGGLR